MDEPKHITERYDWKYILIIAWLEDVLDYIYFILPHTKILWLSVRNKFVPQNIWRYMRGVL